MLGVPRVFSVLKVGKALKNMWKTVNSLLDFVYMGMQQVGLSLYKRFTQNVETVRAGKSI